MWYENEHYSSLLLCQLMQDNPGMAFPNSLELLVVEKGVRLSVLLVMVKMGGALNHLPLHLNMSFTTHVPLLLDGALERNSSRGIWSVDSCGQR
jgi:hypothetical protein